MDIDELTIDALERWALFGAHWRVVEISEARAVVELRTCTDEPVEGHEVRDAGVVAYLRGRSQVPL